MFPIIFFLTILLSRLIAGGARECESPCAFVLESTLHDLLTQDKGKHSFLSRIFVAINDWFDGIAPELSIYVLSAWHLHSIFYRRYLCGFKFIRNNSAMEFWFIHKAQTIRLSLLLHRNRYFFSEYTYKYTFSINSSRFTTFSLASSVVDLESFRHIRRASGIILECLPRRSWSSSVKAC